MASKPFDEEEIFKVACKIGSPEARAEYLREACGDDRARLDRLAALLRVHDEEQSFLESPPSGLAAVTDELPPPAERPGQTIGRYKLLEEIGEGGMGTVWMAEQREPVQRKVALKIIKAGMDTRQVVARFEAERQALALMDHPNIAKVFDGGTTAGGRPFFAMELVKGVPITKYCDEHRLTPRERLELFLPVCQAIQHAHQKGIIHRDVKPSNVLVAPYDGRPVPKVIDFGVAKATGQRLTERTLFTGFGTVVGTLEYMSPEQAELNNHDIDTRSDIYSLGVLLYELLTGTTPLSGERLRQAAFAEMLRLIREEEPPKPSTRLSESKETLPSISAQRSMEPAKLTRMVQGELDWIVVKALEKDRNRRYETANGLALDVQRYLADESVEACPPSVAYRVRKFARRNKAGLAVAGLVLSFLILLGGGGGWVLRDREARREETAQQARESLTLARKWAGESKLALAHRELAAARGRMGSDRAALGSLAEEVEALDAELVKLERFLDLIDRAHEAEFPQAAMSVGANTDSGTAVPRQNPSSAGREPGGAAPYLLEALSCYGVLEKDDWCDQLERGHLGPDQVAQVRRAAYEELLWLADDVVRRELDRRSGRKMSREESAREGLAYLRHADTAARAVFKSPTSAYHHLAVRCRQTLGEEDEARRCEELARQTPAAIAMDYYLQANAAFDARNKADAVRQYEAALRLEPTHYWSLLNLGFCLNQLGKEEQEFALAAMAFTGCIMRRPDHAHAYSIRGTTYASLHQNEASLADCSKAIELDPKAGWAWNNRGNVLYRQGKYAEAEADYRQALRLEPDSPRTHRNLGLTLFAERKYAEAEAEYRHALRLKPDFPEADPTHAELGNALYSQGKHAEAEAEFRQALQGRLDFPEDYLTHYNLGIALYSQGKHAEAEAEYREALRIRSDFPEAHLNLGNVLSNQGKHAEAEAEYREALRLKPDSPEAHNNLGSFLHDQGKDAEAATELREAVRLKPDFPDAHLNLGNALQGQGKRAEAEAEFREALRLRPDFPEAHVNLGAVLNSQGKHAEAEAEYREALRIRPDFPKALLNLGNVLSDQGKHAEAEAAYRQALRVQPDYLDAHLNLGYELIIQKKLVEAEAECRQTLRLRTDIHEAHFNLGYVLMLREKPAEAEAEFREALRLRPDKIEAHFHLGRALNGQGKHAAAARWYAEAFAAVPKLAEDPRTPLRYNAACYASLAGCGQGDGAGLDDAERARLRGQALDWLRADLAAWGRLLEKQPQQARAVVQKQLRQWQEDSDFAGVRGDALAKLPEAERQAWQQLWADVEQTMKSEDRRDTKDTKTPPK